MKMNLPNGWKVIELGSVTDCLDGQRIPLNGEERITMQGDIPYYGANGQLDSINKHIFSATMSM